jgi:secreted trypsin-like serine protease
LTYGGYCGGTLIDKDSVLTAAHCFYDPITRENLLEKDRFLVAAYIGLTVRSNQSQGQFRIVRRASIHIHQDFNLRRNYRYDAAVLELSRPVSGITPIKLATLSQNDLEKPGRDATIAGWGNTIANVGGGQPPEVPGGPATPDRMHEAQVPIVSDFRADQILNDFAPKDPDQYGPSLMIAAGGKGKDACQGDSGGPLFSALESDGNGDNGDGDNGDGDNGDDNNRHDTNGGPGGKYTQIGITSSGFGCGQKTPGVYTEVNNPFVRSFITNVASK